MVRVGKREAPSPIQRATSQCASHAGLYLNTFRGEPAISGFAWHFTATHRSSQPFVTDPGSGLHERVPPASPCPWVDHPVSGQITATPRPFGLAFAPAPPVARLSLATMIYSSAHSTKGTPSPSPTGRLRPARKHTVSGSVSLPSPGCFSPFPHGTGALSVVCGYLALGGGPPRFPPDASCPAVLTQHGSPRRTPRRRLRDSHPLRDPVPAGFG